MCVCVVVCCFCVFFCWVFHQYVSVMIDITRFQTPFLVCFRISTTSSPFPIRFPLLSSPRRGDTDTKTHLSLSGQFRTDIEVYPTLAHRVHSHAATAPLINFCQLRGHRTRHHPPIPRPLIERLFKLLNTPGDSAPVRLHGQEQAITVSAMIADENEVTFAKVCRVPCAGKADRR